MSLTFVVICLAAYRVTRLVTTDDIALRPRLWLTEKLEATRFSSYTKGITCPWCVGFWISLVIVLVSNIYVRIPYPALYVGAVSTVVGLIGGKIDD